MTLIMGIELFEGGPTDVIYEEISPEVFELSPEEFVAQHAAPMAQLLLMRWHRAKVAAQAPAMAAVAADSGLVH